jgi:hypothetical protein
MQARNNNRSHPSVILSDRSALPGRYAPLRLLATSLLLSAAVLAQTPAKMITFNQADTQHCKVVQAGGKPLLEATYEGTSVAIAMPVNRGNGEFLIFVAVSHAAPGAIEVNPKDFYGLFSDPAHTRFAFYDKAAETNGPAGDLSLSAEQSHIDPGSLRPGAQLGGPPPGGGSMGPEPPGGPPSGASAPSAYLRKAKIKQGEKTAGWVALRQPKGSKLEVHSTDMLDEVDIPVNGIVFRF